MIFFNPSVSKAKDKAYIPLSSNKLLAGQVLEEIEIIAELPKPNQGLAPSSARLIATPGAVNDPLRALFALPGVIRPSGWRLFGPIVHGSAPQDNNYYINGIPINYLYHLHGASVIPTSVLQSLSLKKSGFQGFYYDALGGIIDIQLRDPKALPFSLSLDISFLDASVFVESKLSESAAFYMGYKKNLLQYYNDIIDIKSMAGKKASGVSINRLPTSSNYQGRWVWLNGSQSLALTWLGARDDGEASLNEESNLVTKDGALLGKAQLNKGMDTQLAEWKKTSAGFDVYVTLAHSQAMDESDYGNERFIDQNRQELFVKAGIHALVWDSHRVTVEGMQQYAKVELNVNANVPNCASSINADCPMLGEKLQTFKEGITIERSMLSVLDSWQMSDEHDVSFSVLSAVDRYLDIALIEPRAAWQWALMPSLVLKLSAGRYSQFPDASQMIEPLGAKSLGVEKSTQISLNLAKVFSSDWRVSATLYQKFLKDLIFTHKNDDDVRLSNAIKGQAYGADLMLERQGREKINGWVALSLSKTERIHPITKEKILFQYDVPFNLKTAWNYQFNSRWQAGVKWQCLSGNRYTPIVDVKSHPKAAGKALPVYGKQHAARYPVSHQLDIRIDYSSEDERFDWQWYFEVVNLYNQSNITAYRFSSDSVPFIEGKQQSRLTLHEDTGLGVLPSMGLKIVF
ncbi:MAG: TonB-dependent receptor [Cellvibrionales bacterium]|nr:TonB-dependent receptor [Cellvibrionales bacterium]